MSVKPVSIVYTAFAIRDVKTNSFNMPYFLTHKAAAMRAFSDLCTDPQSMIFKHPADFSLYEIGSYDSETAMLIPLDMPLILAQATDFQN